MATIRNRNGRWHVQVRRSGSKSVNRTFTLKSDAQLWAREQERAIELDGFEITGDRVNVVRQDAIGFWKSGVN